MAKPKLALIPAAQGSKFYSVLPSSGVGDFDFTRSGSATRINSQGLIETVGNGVSRLNYPMIDGKVVGCPHHILEPTRSNYIVPSNGFSSWSLGNTVTRTANYGISPDGTLNSTRADFANGGVIYRSPNRPQGAYVFSVFAKNIEGGGSVIALRVDTPSSKVAIFDLSNGTIVSNSSDDAKIEYYGNGWYRCILIQNNDEIINAVIGEGTTELDCELYGAMLEQGSYPTSYIPTNGSAVTRSAETANGSGDASTFNDSEGVLMVEIANSETTSGSYLGICNGSSNERLIIGNEGGLLRVYTDVFVSGSVQSANKDFNKIAVKYNSSNTSIYYNGFLIKSINVSANLSGINELKFTSGGISQNFYGNTKQIQYYDSALTDSELETLTSWVSFSDMANSQLYSVE